MERERENERNGKKLFTLDESHSCTVLSKEDEAKIDELGLNRTSVTIWECPSPVLMQLNVSTFQIKIW